MHNKETTVLISGFIKNFNEKEILDTKQFCKVVKFLFSDKSLNRDKVNLTEMVNMVNVFLKYDIDPHYSSVRSNWSYRTKFRKSTFKNHIKIQNTYVCLLFKPNVKSRISFILDK